MVAQLLPPGQITFLDDDGNPLSNGEVYFYIPATTTFKNTWQDRGQTSLNTNPVQLDAAGRATIWGDGVYRQRVFDELGNEIWDKIVSTVDTSNNTGASGYYGGFTAVGGETSFSLVNQDGDSFTVATGAEVTLGVYINGVKLELANYSTDGSDLVTLINSTTLVAGDLVYYEQTGGINLNVPGPGSISGGEQFASTVTFDGVTVNTDNATQFNFRDGSGLQIKNQGDATKIARFSAAGITTATTRTYAFPDASTTLVGTDATQTLSNKTINSPSIGSPTITGTMGFGGVTLSTDNSSVLNLRDGSALNIANQGDATKVARFSAAGITAGATRTLSFPDASTTLVGTDATQALTNKSVQFQGGGTALNFYEEGSWTPVLAGSTTPGTQTYSVQLGRYTRIGNLCFVQGRVTLTAFDAATNGAMRITGLPFTCAALGSGSPELAVTYQFVDLNAASSYYAPSANVQQGQAYISLMEQGDNVAQAAITNADFANNSSVYISGCYRV